MRIFVLEKIARVNTEVDKVLTNKLSISPSYARVAKTILTCFVAFLLYFATRSHKEFTVPKPRADALEYFSGVKQCNITLSDIYLPSSMAPLCKNRATLLEGGCSYRWYHTFEVCMILERFNAITFVGDNVAHSLYTALNILLREDLQYGGLQQWSMNQQDRERCKCDNQFHEDDCNAYRVTSSGEVKNNTKKDGNERPYYCDSLPHAFITSHGSPSSTSQDLFKDATYQKPHPWQPSPLIYGMLPESVATDTRSLKEWRDLADGAERNIPILFVGSAADLASGSTRDIDVLDLETKFHTASVDGVSSAQRSALVDAMVIINWLAMLESS